MDSKYNKRGVSAGKEDVHQAIVGLDHGLYPTAFCKILPDVLGGSKEYCNILHADTAGTKTALAYLYWKETGDISVWGGIVQDAIVMNTDDMACVGCVDDFILSNTIGRNKALIDGEVIKVLINSCQSFIEKMAAHDVNIYSAGGETADVGDIVRTADVGFTASARMKRDDLIINQIRPGQIIVGLASYGQATYEDQYNSGIGSNGLTMARHELFSSEYKNLYPETFAPQIDAEYVYSGKYKVTDWVEIDAKKYPIGYLTLSPTRTFLPILKQVFQQHKQDIKGIIHNTGGGMSKVLKYLDQSVHIIKDNILTPPPIFDIIKDTLGTEFQELFQVFNMGTRLELYVEDMAVAEDIISISRSFNVEAQVIGSVTAGKGKNQVSVFFKGSQYTYE